MALSSSTLASGLEALAPTDSEATAIDRIATAWDDYFQAATVQDEPIGASTASAKSAMASAMSGLSAANAAASKIQDGIGAYWTALIPLAPSLWVLPPNVTSLQSAPTTISGIASALQAVFDANRSAGNSLETSAAAVASSLHSNGGLGGLVTLTPPPPASPIPNVPIE